VAAWNPLLGLALVVCVVLVAWTTAAHHSNALAPAIATAVAVWLLAQHCALVVPGGEISIVPLALTLLLGALLVRGGRQAVRLTESATPRRTTAVSFAVAVPYSIAGGLLTRAVHDAGVHASPVQGAAGTFVLAIACVGYGALRESGLMQPLVARLPGWSRLLLRAGGVAFAVVLVTGAVGTALALIGHGSRVAALNNSLHPGLSGTALLGVVSLASLPNAMTWTASFAAGPGFAVGTGTSVSLFGVHLGAVPALPLFAPLPQTGRAPAIGWLLVIGLVVAGLVAGWLIASRPTEFPELAERREGEWWLRWRLPDAALALGAGAVAGVLLGGLGWLSAGALGPGRMSDVGPAGLLVGLATAAEVAVVAAATVAGLGWRASRPLRPVAAAVREAPPEPEQLTFDTPDVRVVVLEPVVLEPEADHS
jgi:hypothetical protein